MIDSSPDFSTACERANEILVCSKEISGFPFSVSKVINEFTEIEMRPFSSINAGHLSPAQVVESEDGALFTDGNGLFLMFYNEAMPLTRQRFTGCHELGHYMLDHDMPLITHYRHTQDPRFEPLYKKYEAESNMFASELLMPEPIIIELNRRGCNITEAFLQRTFGVSYEAAKLRVKNIRRVYNWESFRRYQSDYALSYDDIILQNYKPFIDSVAPQKSGYAYDFDREQELELERQSWY